MNFNFVIQDGFSFSTTLMPAKFNGKKRKLGKLNDEFSSSESVLKQYMSSLTDRLSRRLEPTLKTKQDEDTANARNDYSKVGSFGFQGYENADRNAFGTLTPFFSL